MEVIYKDLRRYGITPNIWGGVKGLLIPGFKYTLLIRLIQKNIFFITPVLKLLWRFYSRWYGIQIQYTTQIGEGFYIGHFGTIVVNGNAVLGKNCNISQGVTIGSTNRGARKGTPHVGNDVWIGANAVLVGKITIGNNILIAPNSYVNIDVPDNSIVIGNPCKIISRENATEGYINNRV